MWVLLGIAVVVLGFAVRANPLLVIVAAAAVTGVAAGMTPLSILAVFGKAFNDTRYFSVIWVVLPVIGLLEARGLQERARVIVTELHGATLGRLLAGYMLLRQVTAAVGLASVGGQAQTVRPLLAPMAEAAAARGGPPLDGERRDRVRALAAATDNIGLFFGEDIFVAMAPILLMKGLLDQEGIILTPFELSVWAIPSAIAAFMIHGARLAWVDRRSRASFGRGARR